MAVTAMSDRELVSQVLSGQREAFSGLVARYLKAALAVARVRLANPADADDAVQEAFLRAFERLHTLHDRTKFGPWLLTIARHEAVRLDARRRTTVGAEPESAPEAGAQPDPARGETNALVRARVSDLPATSREVLMLHYFAGHTTREIAELLDIRQGAVLKRLQRAREQLAETLLHDFEADRPSGDSIAKHAARITALTSAIAIEKVVAGSAAASASVSHGLTLLFPKAATIAAAATGMAFTVAIGWMYLSGQTPQADGAADTTLTATAFSQSIEPAQDPIVTQAPTDETGPESMAAVETPVATPMLMAQAENTAPEAAPVITYPNASGTWDVSIVLADTHEEHMGSVTITDLGSALRIVPVEAQLESFYSECRREGSAIVLTMADSDAAGILRGSFDAGYTTLTLEGSIETGATEDADAVEMEVTLIAKRIEPNTLSRAERVRQLREQMQEFNSQLQRYFVNTGSYPESVEQLSPIYIADLAPYQSTETRNVEYNPPAASDEPAIQELARAAMEAETAQELAAIEERLITLWGDRFMNAASILDVRDTELNVHLRLRAIGRIDEVVDFDGKTAETSDALNGARANAQNASCMNNMKQLGLVMRMFENEQAKHLLPAGWRMAYPTYMADTRILTCPGDETGTESYELIYPGATAEWMNALARQLEGLPNDTPGATAQYVPVAVEKHHCSGLDGRNVLFADGHVKRVNDADWDAVIAPYLEYR